MFRRDKYQENSATNNELFQAMKKAQADAHSVSNYSETKRHERKSGTLPRNYKNGMSHQQQVPRSRVKFQSKKDRYGTDYRKKSFSSDSGSDDRSTVCEYDHDYQNFESELESVCDGDYSETLKKMESKMAATTNQYVKKIQSQLSEACSQIKIKEKKRRAKKVVDERAAGDSKKASAPNSDDIIQEFAKVTSACFKKIDENLKILQKMDQMKEQLYRNYYSSK